MQFQQVSKALWSLLLSRRELTHPLCFNEGSLRWGEGLCARVNAHFIYYGVFVFIVFLLSKHLFYDFILLKKTLCFFFSIYIDHRPDTTNTTFWFLWRRPSSSRNNDRSTHEHHVLTTGGWSEHVSPCICLRRKNGSLPPERRAVCDNHGPVCVCHDTVSNTKCLISWPLIHYVHPSMIHVNRGHIYTWTKYMDRTPFKPTSTIRVRPFNHTSHDHYTGGVIKLYVELLNVNPLPFNSVLFVSLNSI